MDGKGMTNYNDGRWHVWNGGECPVHPKSEVQVVLDIGIPDRSRLQIANNYGWDHSSMRDGCIVAFRVVKEYREPREFWIMTENGILRSYRASKPDVVPFGWECLHVREVTE